MKNLPTTLVEAEVQAVIMHWFDRFAELMSNETARYAMRKNIATWVRQGDAEVTLWVIEAARAGHADAALALQDVVDETFERKEVPPTLLLAWHEETRLRPPSFIYPPGRNLADTWLRKVVIAICVDVACSKWNLKPSRTKVLSRTRAAVGRRPSASSLVADAYTCSPHCPGTMGDRQVERIYTDHFKVARKIMPPI